MGNLVLAGATSGSITLEPTAVAGTTTLTLPAANGTVGLVSGNLGTPSTLVGTNITGTANNLNAGLGVNQTWQVVTRSTGVTYTNSTGKPIMAAVAFTNSAANTVQGLTINSNSVYCAGVTTAGGAAGFSLIIPDGATYTFLTNGGSATLVSWQELR